jgi:hypothetical protein
VALFAAACTADVQTPAIDAGPPVDGAPQSDAPFGAATLSGTVRLVGRATHEGVKVRFEPGGSMATSDATGAFTLPVALGDGRVLFDRDGYHEEVPLVVDGRGAGVLAGDTLHPISALEVPHARRLASNDRIFERIVASPDGAHVLFRGACDGCPTDSEVTGQLYLGALDGAALDLGVRVEVNDFQSARWGLEGRRVLLFERLPGVPDDTLMLRLHSVDAAEPLARFEATSFAITRDGTRAAVGTPDGVELLDLTTGTRTPLFAAAARSRTEVELSPSEGLIAFWTGYSASGGDLHVVPAAGGAAIALGAARPFGLRFSADESRIFYRNQSLDLWTSPTQTAAATPVVLAHAEGLVTPDGRTLLSLHGSGSSGRLSAVSLTTGRATLLSSNLVAPGGGASLHLSPGKRFSYYPVVGTDGTARLALRPANGGAERVVGAPLVPGSYVSLHVFAGDDRFVLAVAGGVLQMTDLDTGTEYPAIASAVTGAITATPDRKTVFFVAGGVLQALSVETRVLRPIAPTRPTGFRILDDRTLLVLANPVEGSFGTLIGTLQRVHLADLRIETIDEKVIGLPAVRGDGTLVYQRDGDSFGDDVRFHDGSVHVVATAAYSIQIVDKYAVFTTSGRIASQLHIVDATTGAVRDFEDHVGEVRVSPDARAIAFARTRPGGGTTLYAARLASGPSTALVSGVTSWHWIGDRLFAARRGSPAAYAFQDGAYATALPAGR